MDKPLRTNVLRQLGAGRLMTIATLRPDGWPQATMVGYANDGLRLYFLIARASQKFANLSRDDRVSIAIGADSPDPMKIEGLSMAASVSEVQGGAEYRRAIGLFKQRYPEYAVFPEPDPRAMALMRAEPEIVSVLDYSKGFGHTDLARVETEDL